MPHTLSINQKSERVSYSKVLLTALMEQKASGSQRIITGDKSWFLLYYPCDSACVVSLDELPQPLKWKIDTETRLASILWSFNGIHSLSDVLKGTTYNTAFFIDAVMSSLIENVQSRTRKKRLKGWLIHMDNARPHSSGRAQKCIKASRSERLPHPA
jgi:hypothetical protein